MGKKAKMKENYKKKIIVEKGKEGGRGKENRKEE